MLPFRVEFKTGSPVSEQLIYAVKKAVISGQMQTGDKFPSVRTLSQELRINPNTAHKVVAALVNEGLLEVKPGIGTLVADAQPSTKLQRGDLLNGEVERVVVEAKKLQLELADVVRAIEQHWNRLS